MPLEFQKQYTMFGPNAHVFSGVVSPVGKESTGGASWGPSIQGRFAPSHEMFNEVQFNQNWTKVLKREAKIYEQQEQVEKAKEQALRALQQVDK